MTGQVRRYLPWARTGAATAITTVDNLGAGTPIPDRATLDVAARVNAGAGSATVPVRLYGPGAVTGIDQRQFIHVDPTPGTTNAEPNYFPTVGLDNPETPWLFTPAAATSGDQLRPWLVLVVVRASAATIQAGTESRLPILRVDAQAELPDLTESWAWAHVQVNGTGPVLDALTGTDPALAMSRLVAPRRLDPDTPYVAAVVPAFEPGRAAGLGEGSGEGAEPEEAGTLEPAWTASTGQIELPVYYSWQFATGPTGDFEALVTRLTRRQLDPTEVGGRSMLVADLPAGLPDLGQVLLPGALGAADLGGPQPPATFTSALRALLSLPEPSPPGSPPAGLELPPPSYGRWHAGRRVSPTAPATAGWLDQLNLDVRYRVAAALGTRVVQEQQEQLMAAAWVQAGQILAANQLLRQGQLARQTGLANKAAHYDGADPAPLLVGTASIHARIADATGTVARTIGRSRVPDALLSPAMRKLARPRGPVARRAAAAGGPIDLARLLVRMNDVTVAIAPRRTPAGTVPMDEVLAIEPDRPKLCTLSDEYLSQLQLPGPPGLRKAWDAFRAAAVAHQKNAVGCDAPAPPPRPALDLPGLASTLRTALDPRRTVTARLRGRITRPDGWNRADPLEPVLAAPDFPTPMYRALADLSTDLFLPGVAAIPPNTIAALPANPRFIEAFMVGLNHEMGRELLWRGFPTDQRGTYFRQFWDRSGAVAYPADGPAQAAARDLEPIADWDPADRLGDHLRGGRQFVLLVRGELLRRYPRTAIYLARAQWVQENGAWVRRPEPVVDSTAAPQPGQSTFAERYPDFAGTLPPDVTFLGFTVDTEEARGDPDRTAGRPGWFVVFQQPATEIRFGLDETAPSDPTGTWRDLAWPHVATDAAGYIALGPLPAPPDGPDITTNPNNLGWGTTSTSAQLAAIVEQPPFRIAVHAGDVLPEAPP